MDGALRVIEDGTRLGGIICRKDVVALELQLRHPGGREFFFVFDEEDIHTTSP